MFQCEGFLGMCEVFQEVCARQRVGVWDSEGMVSWIARDWCQEFENVGLGRTVLQNFELMKECQGRVGQTAESGKGLETASSMDHGEWE